MAKNLAFYQLVAFDHLASHDFVDAAELASEGLGRFPEDGRLWQALGIALRRLRHWGRAMEALETASVLVPLHPVARCALADAYLAVGKPGLARDIYLYLVQSIPLPTAVLASLAAGLGKVGDDQRALEVCRELVSREPGNHAARFGVGYYMSRLGHEPEAILPHLEHACQLAPNNASYRANLALVQLALGDSENAVETIRNVSPNLLGCFPMIEKLAAALESRMEWRLAAAWRGRLAELRPIME